MLNPLGLSGEPQSCATRKGAAPGTYGRAKKEIGLGSKWNPALS